MNEKAPILSLSWGVLASRGIIAKLFGLTVLIFYPLTTSDVRIALFAIFASLFGIFSILSIHHYPRTRMRILEAIQGLASIGIGIIAFSPAITTDRLLFFLIAVWAIVIGSIKIILSYTWEKEIPYRWLPKASGILSIAVGLFILSFLPSANVLLCSLYIGTYLIVFGALVFSFFFDLRTLQKRIMSSRKFRNDTED